MTAADSAGGRGGAISADLCIMSAKRLEWSASLIIRAVLNTDVLKKQVLKSNVVNIQQSVTLK